MNPQKMPAATPLPLMPFGAPSGGVLRLLGRQRWFVVMRAFAVFVLLWWIAAAWNGNPLQLPTPGAVLQALIELGSDGELFDHALVSTSRLVIALCVSMALAIPLGFWMGRSPAAEAYVDPLVEMLRPISGIAWLPLALFIFGVGNTLPVFIMVYVGFFPILLNTVAGVQQIDRKLIAAADTMGINRRALLTKVLVPAALPSVVVGVRLAFAASWAAIVAAELIGSPSGLGFAIDWYRQLLMTPKVFAFIMVIGLVGYLCDLGLRRLQRVLTPWIEGTELK
ncbi:ABC transporter permease [Variovorax sp. LG9.2]|uniref:ABC transporter permease n=1 Tax=Variovorax sp. LG9.2 TaxID=3048626 RepID=UPI002B22C9D4|nr:ABC transporter permease [Variovorax sp. LG9.2]MEB0058441.1 ABC transporter permease [Variovorax sp. LG9.2]